MHTEIHKKDFTFEKYGLYVRFVIETDADFIVKIRTNPKLSQYINHTEPDIEKQKQWIRAYKERENRGEEYYFMFEKPLGIRIGVCRIYNISTNDFTVGSWVFSSDAPIGSAILADIITREIAYELFPGKSYLSDVRKNNVNVNKYLAVYKSEIIKENEETIYYTCSQENFEKHKKQFIRMFSK